MQPTNLWKKRLAEEAELGQSQYWQAIKTGCTHIKFTYQTTHKVAQASKQCIFIFIYLFIYCGTGAMQKKKKKRSNLTKKVIHPSAAFLSPRPPLTFLRQPTVTSSSSQNLKICPCSWTTMGKMVVTVGPQFSSTGATCSECPVFRWCLTSHWR
jgi:hypothetical protein